MLIINSFYIVIAYLLESSNLKLGMSAIPITPKIKLIQTKKKIAAARLEETGFTFATLSTRRYNKTAEVHANAKLVIASNSENF